MVYIFQVSYKYLLWYTYALQGSCIVPPRGISLPNGDKPKPKGPTYRPNGETAVPIRIMLEYRIVT